MSVVHQGDDNNLIRQSEENITINRVGAAEARVSYKCVWADFPRLLPRYKAKHPDFSFLLLKERAVHREPGNIARIDCVYHGVVNNQDPTGFDNNRLESGDCTTTSEPIELAPLFASVEDSEVRRIRQAIETNSPYVSLVVAAQKLYTIKLRGVQSYLKPSFVFTYSYIANTPPVKDIAKVGKISNPPKAPGLPSPQNYIFISLSWQEVGERYQITERHQASGQSGWDKELYE